MGGSSRFALATHVLVLLAIENKAEATTSDYLARSASTHPVVIRRLLAMLTKAHLVTTQSGTHGGVQLAQPPDQITLLDIYQAVKTGELFSLGEREANPYCICGRSFEPVMQRVFIQAEAAVAQTLAQTTLADMAQEVKQLDQTHLT